MMKNEHVLNPVVGPSDDDRDENEDFFKTRHLSRQTTIIMKMKIVATLERDSRAHLDAVRFSRNAKDQASMIGTQMRSDMVRVRSKHSRTGGATVYYWTTIRH